LAAAGLGGASTHFAKTHSKARHLDQIMLGNNALFLEKSYSRTNPGAKRPWVRINILCSHLKTLFLRKIGPMQLKSFIFLEKAGKIAAANPRWPSAAGALPPDSQVVTPITCSSWCNEHVCSANVCIVEKSTISKRCAFAPISLHTLQFLFIGALK